MIPKCIHFCCVICVLSSIVGCERSPQKVTLGALINTSLGATTFSPSLPGHSTWDIHIGSAIELEEVLSDFGTNHVEIKIRNLSDIVMHASAGTNRLGMGIVEIGKKSQALVYSGPAAALVGHFSVGTDFPKDIPLSFVLELRFDETTVFRKPYEVFAVRFDPSV